MEAVLARVDTYPEDFQQILADLLEQHYSDYNHDFSEVVVSHGRICDHFEVWEEHVHDYWHQGDRDKVVEYTAAIQRGDKFPPLIADCHKGFLQDGYHRLAAYRALGFERAEFIYIDEQESLLVG